MVFVLLPMIRYFFNNANVCNETAAIDSITSFLLKVVESDNITFMILDLMGDPGAVLNLETNLLDTKTE